MNMNLEIFKDRTLFPLTEPDNANKQTKLKIEPNDFNGDVEGLKFAYSFGKGEGLYFDAPLGTCRQIKEALEDVLKKSEKQTLSFENSRGNKPPTTLHVGRGDDLVPFIALSGDVNGQKKSKKFFWYPAKFFTIMRNGQPLSDLELRERCARSFVGDFELFIEWTREVYKPRDFEKKGFGGQSGGYQQRGGNNSYGNNNQQRGGYSGGGQQQAQATQTFDDVL